MDFKQALQHNLGIGFLFFENEICRYIDTLKFVDYRHPRSRKIIHVGKLLC